MIICNDVLILAGPDTEMDHASGRIIYECRAIHLTHFRNYVLNLNEILFEIVLRFLRL